MSKHYASLLLFLLLLLSIIIIIIRRQTPICTDYQSPVTQAMFPCPFLRYAIVCQIYSKQCGCFAAEDVYVHDNVVSLF